MNLRALTAIVSLMLLPCVSSRGAAPEDSCSVFKLSQLIAPAITIGSGLAIHQFSHNPGIDDKIRDYTFGTIRKNGEVGDCKLDDWLQYAPLAMDLGLQAAGFTAKHDFFDRAAEAAAAYVTFTLINHGIKFAVDCTRPNGKGGSFPSGHTGTVCLGAELVRMEYGWGWGAAAYGFAVTVGALRIYNNWHWFSDVLAGAGLGILCAHAGEWLLDPTRKLLGKMGVSFYAAPCVDPVTQSYGASLALVF